MIVERTKELIENSYWRQQKCDVDISSPKSIRDRLASLTESTQGWQNRVPTKSSATAPKMVESAPKLARTSPTMPGCSYKTPENPPKTTNLKIDSGLQKFFTNRSTVSSGSLSNTEIDLDAIPDNESTRLSIPTRPRAPTTKKRRASSHTSRISALKKTDIQEVIEEEVVEDEELTEEQAIENVKKVKAGLKRAKKECPYPDVMLIQVRGSRHIDVRLVAPYKSSIHENGCFVIVTRTNLFKYEGEESNILEKTKATQICIDIVSKSDLFCSASEAILLTEATANRVFSKILLNNDRNVNIAGGYQESFEKKIAEVNLVLRITEDYEVQSVLRGEIPTTALFNPEDNLIFDFGSEIYVWSGRDSKKLGRQHAIAYAQQLKETGIGESCDVLGDDFSEKRPDWIVSRRFFQGVQDTLFKWKFPDWKLSKTETSRSILAPIKDVAYPVKETCETFDVEGISEKMLRAVVEDPVVVIEDHAMCRKLRNVVTENVSMWMLVGEKLEEIEFTDTLMTSNCYVVRWQYRIQVSGIRRLKTGAVEERETGRSRLAFFYWLGKDTTVKQQGLCALKIKYVDKDKSPHIRVVQGNEPSVFLSLFAGHLTIRKTEGDSDVYLAILGGSPGEAHGCEVDAEQSLRSHAVYVKTGKNMTIVAGSRCSSQHVQFAFRLIDHLVKKNGSNKTSDDTAVSVEGDDASQKWIFYDGRTRCPRFFRIIEGQADILSHEHEHESCAFTFWQYSLADTILVDVGSALFLWSQFPLTDFALHLAQAYWKDKKGVATVVRKGSEPDNFKAIFMQWEEWPEDDEDLSQDAPVSLEKMCAERFRKYTIEELRERSSLPTGIDLKKLEDYLSDNDFVNEFKMSRQQFYALQKWKQNELRKKAGLF